MDEQQFQLGIRKLEPHQMVALIVGYRGLAKIAIATIKHMLLSETNAINPLQQECLKALIADSEKYIDDYTTLLED